MLPKRPAFRKTFIRQWRLHRNMTLEQLAERIDSTASALSMLERGQRGYSQLTLEIIAEALQTDVASLLMRNPEDPDSIWSIWDQASEAEKQQITAIAEALKRSGSRH